MEARRLECTELRQVPPYQLLPPAGVRRAALQVTDQHEEADAIVINTCAFVEDAKAESLEVRAV